MTPERWQRIDQLFEAALELEPEEWIALLDRECAGDKGLRREVESLLTAHKQSGGFIEDPPAHAAAELLEDNRTEFVLGQQVGRYKILELLGEGGMGQVYLAWDTRLGRKVALKLLPSHFAQDKDRLRRFEREAHAASSLNHHAIVTIHEIDLVDSRPFIVTEFIDGETLRENMGGAPMKLNEKLDIVIQVAGALAAAHEAGIVHRDIKPENIMLRRDGYIKVLDFGIAKLTEGGDDDPTAAKWAMVKTDDGMVVGTTTYMSPEQARGLAVDARTDIWSLGVVLYEMVTGKVPFAGSTNSDVIVSVLEREPTPLAAFSTEADAKLQPIVDKALMKDREGRYQTVKDLLVDLRPLKQRLDSDAETAVPAERIVDVQVVYTTSSAADLVGEVKRHKRAAILIAAMLAIAATAVAFGLYEYLGGKRSQPASPFQRMTMTRLTTNGMVGLAAISPDGKYVAYTVIDPPSTLGPRQSLWVRQVVTGRDVQFIPSAESWSWILAFSRDGNYIQYIKGEGRKEGALYQMPVIGGVARKLRDVTGLGSTIDLALSPDGQRLAFVREEPDGGESRLMMANALDGDGEHLLATHKKPDLISRPMWSPDGGKIACAVGNAEAGGMSLVEVRVADGAERPITSRKWKIIQQGAWLPDGSGLVLPASDQRYESFQLWHISYPSGEVRRVTNDLSNYYRVSPTADSAALVTIQNSQTSHVWIVPNGEASRASQIILAAGKNYDYWGFSWTPDNRIVYESTAGGNQDLWVMDQDGSHQKQLTVDAGGNFDPVVTHDGRYIVFASNRSGKDNIWRMDSDGTNLKQLTKGVRDLTPSCSPDGRWVVYMASDLVRLTLWKVPIDGGDPVQLTDYFSSWPSISLDGEKIACWYSDEQAHSMKLAIIPFAGGQPIKTFDIAPTVDTWGEVRWTTDGRGLTYVNRVANNSNLWIQPLGGGPPKQLTDFKSDGMSRFEWSRDGKQFVCSRVFVTNDVVMISDFR